MSRLVLLSLAVVMAAAGAERAEAQSAVRWESSIERAQQIAAETNRLVLLHFWRPSCGPCVKLDRNVFSQGQFAAALETDFVPVKVNTDDFPQTARKYTIEFLPTDVILAPDGRVVRTTSCSQDAVEYAQSLRQIAQSYRQANADFAAAGRGSERDESRTTAATYAAGNDARDTYGQNSANAARPVAGERRYADEALAPTRGNETRSDASGGNYHTPGGYSEPGIGGSNLSLGGTRSQPAARMASRDYAGSDMQLGGTGAGLANGAPRYADRAASGPAYDERAGMSVGGSAGGNPSAGSQPAAAPAATATAQPSLCLDGFCPVSLVESQRWTPGDRRFGAVHRGRIYLFANEAAQQRFMSDPDRYSPAISGHDAVAWVEQGRMVPGARKFGGYFRGFVYLFSSEEALRQFEANPERYASAAEKTMSVARR